jgi:hypothetical protein
MFWRNVLPPNSGQKAEAAHSTKTCKDLSDYIASYLRRQESS